MLIIARTTGVQIVVMNGKDSVLVGTENRKVFCRCLKTASDGADATWRGIRSIQTVAPETGNARLPTVETNGRNF